MLSTAAFAACVTLVTILTPLSAAAQECLHGARSTAEQEARKKAALSAARQVNSLQATGSVARKGKYLTRLEMSELHAEASKKRPGTTPLAFDRSAEILPGFELTFDLTQTGYWFMIKDKTDPCGFAYISNENGVIFTAEPIR